MTEHLLRPSMEERNNPRVWIQAGVVLNINSGEKGGRAKRVISLIREGIDYN